MTQTDHIYSDNSEKFSRQMMLPFIGEGGQKKLKNSHIVVVGCGGLGCPLLLYLAASGIGTITIIDNDTVSLTNLHRQILFSHHDIGYHKAVIAAKKLAIMHPDTHIIPITQRLDSILAQGLCADGDLVGDLVIDGTDGFLSKYILSELCPIFLTASVVGMKGYIAGFTHETPYREIFPEIPDNAQNCSQTGVLGSVAGLIGTLLATEAIKILLNHDNSVMQKMIMLDLDTFHFTHLKLNSNLKHIHHKLPQFQFISSGNICNGTVIDVRETHELVDMPLINGSLSMPLSELNMKNLLSIQNPIFKCQTGRRAERAALKLGLYTDTVASIKIIIP